MRAGGPERLEVRRSGDGSAARWLGFAGSQTARMVHWSPAWSVVKDEGTTTALSLVSHLFMATYED